MIKEYELTILNNLRALNQEPFLLVENDYLQLKFSSECYNIKGLVVILRNGKKQGKFRLENEVFEIPKEFLFGGELQIQLNYLVNGETVKSWDCYPILIKEVENGYEMDETLNILEKKVEDLTRKYENLLTNFNLLAQAHNELTDTVSAIKENY